MGSDSTIIGICGRYFAGKTIIAHLLSCKLGIYTIIHTDTIKFTLLLQKKEASYLSSPTYTLSQADLIRQFNEVANLTVNVSKYLLDRGESHLVEGIHFNDKLSKYISDHGTLIYIKNNLRIEDRIMLKNVTRKKLRYNNGSYMPVDYINSAVDTYYIKYKDNIKKIDEYMDALCMKYSKNILNIDDIKANLVNYSVLKSILSSLL